MSNKTFAIRKGFGLLEAVIASGLVVMIAAGSVGLASTILRSTSTFDDQIVATNLAGEALEVAHLVRDKNVADDDPLTDWSNSFKKDKVTGANLNCPDTQLVQACGIVPVRTDIAAGTAKFKGYTKTQLESENFGYINTVSNGQTIEYNGKTYVRKVYITVKDATNTVTVRSVVLDLASNQLADLATTITNWKTAE